MGVLHLESMLQPLLLRIVMPVPVRQRLVPVLLRTLTHFLLIKVQHHLYLTKPQVYL